MTSENSKQYVPNCFICSIESRSPASVVFQHTIEHTPSMKSLQGKKERWVELRDKTPGPNASGKLSVIANIENALKMCSGFDPYVRVINRKFDEIQVQASSNQQKNFRVLLCSSHFSHIYAKRQQVDLSLRPWNRSFVQSICDEVAPNGNCTVSWHVRPSGRRPKGHEDCECLFGIMRAVPVHPDFQVENKDDLCPIEELTVATSLSVCLPCRTVCVFRRYREGSLLKRKLGTDDLSPEDDLRNLLADPMITGSNTPCLGAVRNTKEWCARYAALLEEGSAVNDCIDKVIRARECTWMEARAKRCEVCERLRLREANYHSRQNNANTAILPRTHASSRCRVDYLTRDELKLRLQNVVREERRLKRVIDRLQRKLQSLGERSTENIEADDVTQLMAVLYGTRILSPELLQTEKEVLQVDKSNTLRFLWAQQVEALRRARTGTMKGIRWNAITLRIALAIACRSPATYRWLSSENILKLPTMRTLQSYIRGSTPSDDVRALESYTLIRRQFEAFKKEFKRAGPVQPRVVDHSFRAFEDEDDIVECEPEPLGELLVNWDEITIKCGIVYNSRSQQLTGFAIPRETFGRLDDVVQQIYATLHTPTSKKMDGNDILRSIQTQQAKKVLQFMIRDLTSSFQTLGPAVPVGNSVTTPELLEMLESVINNLDIVGFRTRFLLCDGTAVNLGVLQTLCGDNLQMTGRMQDWVLKPYFLNRRGNYLTFVAVDPTHMLKSLRNALYNSRHDSTTRYIGFQEGFLDWGHVAEAYERDCQRAAAGQKQETRLSYQSVHLTGWSKMRMDFCYRVVCMEVVDEMRRAAAKRPVEMPDHAQATREYLKHLIALFPMGLLRRKGVYSLDDPVIDSLKLGIEYFKRQTMHWESTTTGMGANDARKKYFALITLQELMMTLTSFDIFISYFLRHFPAHHLSLLRINQSALESIFGHIRQLSGSGRNPTMVMYLRGAAAHGIINEAQTGAFGSYSIVSENDTSMPVNLKDLQVFRNPENLIDHVKRDLLRIMTTTSERTACTREKYVASQKAVKEVMTWDTLEALKEDFVL